MNLKQSSLKATLSDIYLNAASCCFLQNQKQENAIHCAYTDTDVIKSCPEEFDIQFVFLHFGLTKLNAVEP